MYKYKTTARVTNFYYCIVLYCKILCIGIGAQSTLGARHFCPKIYVWKINKCPNYTRYLPEKYFLPNFWVANAPLPPLLLCLWEGPSRGGKVFPGPATFGGPGRRSKILKMVFQMASFWPKICIKSIFSWGSTPDPAWGAYDAPRTTGRMVKGHPSLRFLPLDAFGVSISRHTKWGVIPINPRTPHFVCDNVFPGPAVALERPACELYFIWSCVKWTADNPGDNNADKVMLHICEVAAECTVAAVS